MVYVWVWKIHYWSQGYMYGPQLQKIHMIKLYNSAHLTWKISHEKCDMLGITVGLIAQQQGMMFDWAFYWPLNTQYMRCSYHWHVTIVGPSSKMSPQLCINIGSMSHLYTRISLCTGPEIKCHCTICCNGKCDNLQRKFNIKSIRLQVMHWKISTRL